MASPKDGKQQVNLVVDSERKDEWEQYADEQYGSLSHLIRASVERELSTNGQPTSGNADIPDDLSDTLTDIQQSLNRVERNQSDVDRRLANVEKAMETPPDDVRELANTILDTLPEGRESAESELNARKINGWNDPVLTRKIADGQHTPLTIDELAEALDTPDHRVSDAIDMLDEDTYMIRSDEWDEHTCYWVDL